jgi:hypothetical protein
MTAHNTPVAAFNTAANSAEAARQVAVSGASGASAQATVRSAEITYYRACLNAAVANGIGAASFSMALRSLGVAS